MNIDELKSLFSYDPDTGVIRWIAKGKGMIKKKAAGTLLHSGYLGICVGPKRWQAHRIAWALHHGTWPKDQIDHINGVKTDNRICNLREATNSQNGKNLGLSKANKSGVKGVSFENYTQRWKASIKVENKTISLGRFNSIEDAAIARRLAEQHYFKEWNRT
jgi:HNH endonuclease/AP2 domain